MNTDISDKQILEEIQTILKFVRKKSINSNLFSRQECIAVGYFCANQFGSIQHMDYIFELLNRENNQKNIVSDDQNQKFDDYNILGSKKLKIQNSDGKIVEKVYPIKSEQLPIKNAVQQNKLLRHSQDWENYDENEQLEEQEEEKRNFYQKIDIKNKQQIGQNLNWKDSYKNNFNKNEYLENNQNIDIEGESDEFFSYKKSLNQSIQNSKNLMDEELDYFQQINRKQQGNNSLENQQIIEEMPSNFTQKSNQNGKKYNQIQQDEADEQKLIMEQIQLQNQQEQVFNKCVICSTVIQDPKDIVFIEDCTHIYHQICFTLVYTQDFEQIPEKDLLQMIEQQDNKEYKQQKILHKCQEQQCKTQINLWDYKEYFEIYKKQLEKIQQNKFLCLLCLQNLPNEQQRVLDCDHSYCLNCIKEYLIEKHKKNEAILCPNCRKLISEFFIEDIMPDQQNLIDHRSEISQILEYERMLETAKQLCNGDEDQAKQIVTQQNFLELGAVNKLVACQRNALNYVAKTAKIQSDKAYPTILHRFNKLGYPKEVLDRTLAYIRDEAPITINFRLDLLQKFLKDTHYRNRHEIQKQKCQTRDTWENNMFDKQYAQAQLHERVKYGALNIYNDPGGISSCAGYGKSYFVLKEVRLRTTFYDKDTGGFNKNLSLGTCQHYAHLMQSYNDKELTAIIEIATGQKTGVDSQGVFTSYKEVQIHGDVQFSKHIQFMFYSEEELGQHKNKRELIKQFGKKFGVECIPIQK